MTWLLLFTTLKTVILPVPNTDVGGKAFLVRLYNPDALHPFYWPQNLRSEVLLLLNKGEGGCFVPSYLTSLYNTCVTLLYNPTCVAFCSCTV